MDQLLLRDLSGMADFLEAEDLQRSVWGKGDLPDPGDLMMVIQAEGGLCAGAFSNEKMLGYVFAFPTRTPSIHHSHRLAVLPEMRGLGLGVRLKWYQRDWCLARDIKLVRWTYDPLRVTNASLNIANLGARSHTYHTDYYSAMQGINAGAPSDRLLVEWHLDDPDVALRAKGLYPTLPLDRVTRRVKIRSDFADLLHKSPDDAMVERLRVRNTLIEAFDQNEEIAGFDRQNSEYLLQHRLD